ncbi:hypothetical protein TNCV_1167821 [Trichonephila clavipes]|uniref:Uncharacterized protein n=1 Tax=Trichonephila clavipes TaxID=2585209 RepID=A0A8X6VK15_TRICX|nr:hypothetical protein TNCV_1167821 [Trichonephila clavipes]
MCGCLKCIMPLQYGGTLNSRQDASSLARLVEGKERWEAPDYTEGVLPQNWCGIEPNPTVTSMVLKAKGMRA